jgi:hypothetical protein
MVERIGALDPREQFKDCTEDINNEIRKFKPSTSTFDENEEE